MDYCASLCSLAAYERNQLYLPDRSKKVHVLRVSVAQRIKQLQICTRKDGRKTKPGILYKVSALILFRPPPQG